ncbi:hypothetical protein EV380_2530 [Zhihengliuella halotolerans]|uniref:FtsX-like permease family protein n=2 Tax=Zhihengliuella halotolerans TaxID=370736 RepID=A0A4Q8AGP1_9MICC|nr:hypothetical protein EV380_2530 [Zhihengliuella halotolerans]
MNNRNGLVTGSLLVLFMLLGSALTVYSVKQEAITLEGNKLYSTESIQVSGDAERIAANAHELAPEARVYVHLPGNARVRNLLIEDASGLSLPLYEGRVFASGEHDKAIVGSEIPVVERGGVEYFEYDGESYEVTGRLGTNEESLLSADVLISDPDRTSGGLGDVVVDLPDAHARYVDAFGADGVASIDGSTNKRTNIDYVSPILLGLGFTIVTIGAAMTGLLAATLLRRRHEVLHLLGHRRARTAAWSAGQVVGVAVGAGLPAALIVAFARDPLVSVGNVLRIEAALAAIVVVVFVLAVVPRKGVRSWS